jgi:hypothetical protein
MFRHCNNCDELLVHRRYGRLILRTIASMSHFCALSNAVLSLGGQHEVHEELGGFVLHKGKPGVECGHVTDASSYFDRCVLMFAFRVIKLACLGCVWYFLGSIMRMERIVMNHL